jgi:hypothetical protein
MFHTIVSAELPADYWEKRRAVEQAEERRNAAMAGPHRLEIVELEERAKGLRATKRAIMHPALLERRTLSHDEGADFDAANAELDEITRRIRHLEAASCR